MRYFGFLTLAVIAVGVGEFNIRAAFALRNDEPRYVIHEKASSETPVQKKFRKSMALDVRSQIAARMSLPVEEFDVEVENVKIEPTIDLHAVKSLHVLGLGTLAGRRMEGLFSLPVTVRMGDDAASEREIQVIGVLKVTGPVYTAKSQLARGRVLESNDLMLSRLPWRGLPSGSFGLSSAELVGQRVKAHISAGNPFTRELIDEPLAVKAGETVDLTVVSGPGVIIRSRAVAKQEGKVGDAVRIEQPDTRKVLLGTVIGSKTVEIRL